MPESEGPGRPLRLTQEFPPVSTEAWNAAVRHDLKGSDYDKRLVWRPEEGLTLRPYYREEDLAGFDAQTSSAPGAWPWVRGSGRPWSAAGGEAIPAAAVRADRLHDAGATTVQEIGYALAEGVDRLSASVAAGGTVAEAAATLTFVFAVGSPYFLEIAKLRAARLCWAQIVDAFAGATGDEARMRMVVRTARANKSRYDPYTNLLRVTTEAMSAACGGADAILVEATGFDRHLADNVTRILAEEARLDAVSDPAGGSYYVEALTDQLGRAAWQLMQEVESAGGFASIVASGALASSIARSRAQKERAVSTRRRTLVGVNNYPDFSETGPSGPPSPEDPAPGLPAWRMAEPFESIRARTERFSAATGRRPEVLLLTRGDVRMREARANFCLNFFGCAGFAVTQAETLDDRTPDLIVLCSSDPEYGPFAADICPKVDVPVLVAGYPRDQVAALEATGVAGFVHVQSDAVETLSAWQQRLGM